MTTASIDFPQKTSTRVSAWRYWVRVVLRDLLIILVLVAAGEVTLRRWAPQYTRNLYDEEFTGSRPMAFNREGYRGYLPPIPKIKQPDELRVLALGDSVTFGTGLGVEETWPEQLAAQLRDHSGRKVSAINGGMAAADLNQLRLAYEQKWVAYSPDVVTLVVTGNMVSLAWIRRNDPPSLPHNGYLEDAARRAALSRWLTPIRRACSGMCVSAFASINCRLLLHATGVIDHNLDPAAPYGVLLAFGWKQGGIDPDLAIEAWRIFETDLGKLADSISQRGGRLVVAFAPPRFLVSDSVFDNLEFVPRDRFTIDPAARLQEICGRHQIPCADALASMRQYRGQIKAEEHRGASMYMPGDYTHFDRDGSAAIAGALRELIRRTTVP